MSELSDILTHTDFEHISLENLVHLEDSLSKFENTPETETLAALKQKIADKYAAFKDRFGVHKIRTGYDEKNWGKYRETVSPEDFIKQHRREAQEWNPNKGWKFHLDVVPNRDHPVTKAVSEWLLDLGVNHKVADGGDNGKGMTVYVGSYEDINRLAKEIQKRFGKDIYEPPAYTNQVRQEHAFEPTVYGRFVCGAKMSVRTEERTEEGQWGDYPWYGLGISPIHMRAQHFICRLKGEDVISSKEPDDYFEKTYDKALELGLVKDKENNRFTPRGNDYQIGEEVTKDGKKEVVLRHYCSHKLYAEALGSYYCGTDIDAFERSFFKNELPAKGTEERKKWDEVANTFVGEAKEMLNGLLFNHLKSFTNGYMPIDFSRLPAEKVDAKEQDSSSKTPEKTAEPKPVSAAKQQKKITAEEHIPDPTPEEKADAPKNQDFKEPWRKFYQKAAAKENAVYSEDKDSAHYKATFSRTNGEKLEITATPQHKVSLGAKDKDGNSKVPSYEDFNNLVLAAKEQGGRISFGKIKTPEFRARLMLACLENNVDIKTLPEFGTMEGLEPETKQRLAKHKIAILKRMVQDKEQTGEYSGLSLEEKIQRQKMEQAKKAVLQARKNNQTDTPEYQAAKDMLLQRRLKMDGKV